LGPSGSGKSTILKLISGLESPTMGRIFMNSVDITELPPKDRDVAMVFQNYALYPHMTVRENLSFPLENRGIGKEKRQTKIQEVTELLRISHLLDKRPSQLSGGEAQRVALGRAIVRNPKVFLMDEPLSNLDARLRVYMRAEIRKLQRELGTTTVYVTHDQVEAMTMADEVAAIFKGIIHQVGPPEEVYKFPKDLDTATFLGSPPMDTFPAKILGFETNSLSVDIFNQKLILNHVRSDKFSVGQKVIVGIRPEDISLEQKGVFSGVVEAVEPLGRENILHVKVADANVQIITKNRNNIGDVVRFNINVDMVKLFDSGSGALLL
jgi:ABC-type sugar transport system ATPase subunit